MSLITDTIQQMSQCNEVYPIPGFPGYWVTGNLQMYSTQRRGLRQMQTYRVDGQPVVTLAKNGRKCKRRVKHLLNHARDGIDPSLKKTAAVQQVIRLTERVDGVTAILHGFIRWDGLDEAARAELLDKTHHWLNQLAEVRAS